MDDGIFSALPAGLGWGALAVLLVRALVQNAPRIVDSISRALAERATAHRIEQEVRLTEAETEKAESQERRELHERVDELERKLREQEAMCGEEIRSAHELHAVTRDAFDEFRAKYEREKREWNAALDRLRAEFEARIREAESTHTPRST